MRAQSMPAATRLSTNSGSVAASGGKVAITRARGPLSCRLPNSRSASASSSAAPALANTGDG